MKKCSFCGNKNFKETVGDYIYRHDGDMMLFNGVPCEECDYCGERYYHSAVIKEIEKTFAAVHSKKKKPLRTLQVPVTTFSSAST